MKKIIILFFLLMPFAHAELLVNFGERISSIDQIERSTYYYEYYLSSPQESDYTLVFHYTDEKINKESTNSMFILADIDASRLYRIDLLKNNELKDSVLTNFCNYDSICENNLTKGIFENELTCSDCEKSSKDNFCKIEDDDICDPDCLGYNYDEFPGTCLEDYFRANECSNYCSENEICTSDVFVSEFGLCCTGECVKNTEDFCGEYLNGTICSEKEMCNGQEVVFGTEGKTCCYGGTCEEDKNVDYYNITLINDTAETKDLNIYFIIGIFASLLLLVIGLHYKNLNIVIASSLFFILMLSFLLLDARNIITGKATSNTLTQEEINLIMTSPSVFNYGGQSNTNLFLALKSISSEFRKRNVEFSENLMIATITTMEKEVQGYGFLPVEEYGDYCMGKGCTYKVGGVCRSEPYYGGCDYKGRGYIQVTHYSGYLKYCGPDCVTRSTTGNILDDCNCKGKAYCSIKDESKCPPNKALRPEYAGRIFSNFYIGKGLLGFVDSRDYSEVGYRINGARSYGTDFQNKANAKHNSYNKEQVRKLLAYFNQRSITPPPTNPTEPNPTQTEEPVSVDTTVSTDVADEIISGDKLGYYYLNPSFKLETELSFIPTLVEEAKDYETLKATLKKYDKEEKWTIGGCGEIKKIDEESTKFIFCVDDGTKKIEFALDLEGKIEPKITEVEREETGIPAIETETETQTETNTQEETGGEITEGFSEIFSGIQYGKFSAAGPIVYHVTKIDLRNPNIRFLVTPQNQLGQPTSSFFAANRPQVAINGDEFWTLGSPKGVAVSNGNVYSSSAETGEQTVFISTKNEVSIGSKIPQGTLNAVSGSHVFLENGAVPERIRSCSKIPYCNDMHPRTSIGVSKDGNTMILITVDGRRSDYSIGIKLHSNNPSDLTLAKLHLAYGSYNAINLDGGGSTTLVMEGKGIVNNPTDPPEEYLNDAAKKAELIYYDGFLVHPNKNIFRERYVSNHLGIYAAKAPAAPEKTNQESCLSDDLDIVLFGDSITEGHATYGNKALSSEFNSRISKEITLFYTTGLGGMRAESQKSIDSYNNFILPKKPDIVLLWFGMNSHGFESSHKTQYMNYINDMKKEGIIPVILTTSPACDELTEKDISYLEDIQAINKDLAKTAGVYLIDVKTKLENEMSGRCKDYFMDAYHMNPQAHSIVAKIVVDQFSAWKKAKTGPYSC